MYLKELDIISHFSFDVKFLHSSGLYRGSDIVTEDGEKIKAGTFSFLFYTNTKLVSNKKKRHQKYR